MSMPDEKVIRDELEKLRVVHKKASQTYAPHKSLQKNVMDPLSSILHCSFGGLSWADYLKMESARRIDKSMTNAIGVFHENVLASLPGWKHPQTGVDLICEQMKIAAEVKNKHNTVNSTTTRKIHDALEEYLRHNPDFTTYFVAIIPKKGKVNKAWPVANKKSNEKIRIVDGFTFYDMASREKGTLEWVYAKLSEILKADESLRREIGGLFDDAYRPEMKKSAKKRATKKQATKKRPAE